MGSRINTNISFSCGVRCLLDIEQDYQDFHDYDTAAKYIVHKVRKNRLGTSWLGRYPFVMWSSIATSSMAVAMLAYIEKHKLGKVIATDPVLNENSSNEIKVWIWTIDVRALAALDDGPIPRKPRPTNYW